MTSDTSPHQQTVRQYILVTLAYWGFTLTDGALRMLVLLHFHTLGYSPLQLASLFLLYEMCGIVTNITGGWLGSKVGLNRTLILGLLLQIFALLALSFLDQNWPLAFAVPFVVAVQGVSGIAKDFTKMSAKSSLKWIIPQEKSSTLLKWVALLTGSKNTLKGIGFFLGGLMLTQIGFNMSLWAMAGALVLTVIVTGLFSSSTLGKSSQNISFLSLFAKTRSINLLSAARFFLFGARDIWFVVALPLFLYETLGLDFSQVGGLMALWVIGYGAIQAAAPMIIRKSSDGQSHEITQNKIWVFILSLSPLTMAWALSAGYAAAPVILIGLAFFGAIFAINSALHSYLVLAFSPRDHAATTVGFYYSANAGGRLLGTALSGLMYQFGGLEACLIGSSIMVILAFLFSLIITPSQPT